MLKHLPQQAKIAMGQLVFDDIDAAELDPRGAEVFLVVANEVGRQSTPR